MVSWVIARSTWWSLLFASAVATLMVLFRLGYTGARPYYWLVLPNLVLAWIPLLLALLLRRLQRPVAQIAVGAAWLLFLPNAPYILTDFVHLTWVPALITVHYDIAMIGAVAVLALYLGFLAMALVQDLVAGRFGGRVGWLFACAGWGLVSLGVYLGRIPRFNSWDIVRVPWRIVEAALFIPRGEIPMVVGFTLALIALYLPFWSMLRGGRSQGT